MEPAKITILGSTGSIGQNTLDVIAHHPLQYQVVALSANRNITKLLEQCCVFKPSYAAVSDPKSAKTLAYELKEHGLKTQVLSGNLGLCEIATLPEVDKVVAAIVGSAGLLPTLSAVKAGKHVLLANKEALVMSGDILLAQAKSNKAVLLPIDSEHNALFQCMPKNYMTGERPVGVSRLVLTASGGPFLHFSPDEFANITPEMACKHPNWSMGKKITVDCSTLMNKGLEVIEACQLFQFGPKEVDVLVHPQSIVHSLVEYCDGSFLAQLGSPDMRIPIAFCLGWPGRIAVPAKRLSLSEVGELTFLPPDYEKFPCLSLAIKAAELGKAAPTVLNASNEEVVTAFLNGAVRFLDIPTIIENVLERFYDRCADSLEAILLADKLAREKTSELITKLSLRV